MKKQKGGDPKGSHITKKIGNVYDFDLKRLLTASAFYKRLSSSFEVFELFAGVEFYAEQSDEYAEQKHSSSWASRE